MFKLACTFQNYAWGKACSESEVAKIVQAGKHSDKVDESKNYAEFWMGVHPNGPSKIAETGELLSEKVGKDSALLGAHEEGNIQFLFKVLSVRTALSVQTHPTKEQAKLLHSSDPKNYPDPNHKPEMAIALTDFQLLCGFRPAQEIEDNLKNTPELLNILGDATSLLDGFGTKSEDQQQAGLKEIFTKIWSSDQATISKTVANLVARLNSKDEKSNLDKLILRLDSEFPGGDVGVFAPYLLNYFTLSPGQATFLGPNRPHAYLLGDCIECMACSDNTIRAGLTPKFKDIKTLCNNTDYKMSPPPIFDFTNSAEGIRLYNPPVPEFAVEEIKSSATQLLSNGASSILIIVRGSATLKYLDKELSIGRGDVVFTSASVPEIQISNSSADFLAFKAFTPK